LSYSLLDKIRRVPAKLGFEYQGQKGEEGGGEHRARIASTKGDLANKMRSPDRERKGDKKK